MSHDTPINEDILAELNKDSDFIKPADDITGDAVSITDPDGVGTTPDVQEAIDAISAQDSEAEENKQAAVKVGELKDVADRIMATETISIVDAEEVQRVYGGLEESVAPVATYSEAPTKTNLVPTQRYVAKKLTEETDRTLVRHLNYVNATYGSSKKLLELLKGQMAELLAEFEEVRIRAAADLSKASLSQRFKAFTAESGEGGDKKLGPLVDMKAVCLYSQDFNKDFIIDGNTLKLPTREETYSFREVYFSDAFKKLLRSSEKASRDPLVALHRAFHNDTGSGSPYGVSYIDLLTLFSSGKVEYLLTLFVEEVERVSKIVDEEYEKLTKPDAEIVPWSEEFRESTLLFSNFYEALLQLEKYRMVTKMFIYRSLPIIEGFGSVL